MYAYLLAIYILLDNPSYNKFVLPAWSNGACKRKTEHLLFPVSGANLFRWSLSPQFLPTISLLPQHRHQGFLSFASLYVSYFGFVQTSITLLSLPRNSYINFHAACQPQDRIYSLLSVRCEGPHVEVDYGLSDPQMVLNIL